MNTIESVPDREPADRTTEPATAETKEPSRTADASERSAGGPDASMRTAVMDEAFVADLDARMAKADLKELGWRDRSDIDAVLLDLERLAGASWQKAATLWDKYRPDDPDKPIYIDGDDKDPVPGGAARKGPQPSPEPEENKTGREGADTPDTGDEARSKVVVPKSVINRYLVTENRFYFRDDPNLLAFEDKGKRLATEHNDPQVAQSMVELAHAKHWNSIRVKGSVEFKREVWLAASLRGLEVQGFEPRAVDKARLAELRSEFQVRQQNTIEQGIDRDKVPAPVVSAQAAEPRRQQRDLADDADKAEHNLTKQQRTAVAALRAILAERGDSAQAIEMAATMAAERFQQQRAYVGRLLAHGPAPYEHKPDEKPNYFVTLQTPEGKQTIWGVDLKRAIAAAKVEPGEDMALASRGKKQVTVSVAERDQAGKLTGKQVDTVVNRNAWEVGKLDKMREDAQRRVRAAAEQTARDQPEVRVYDVPSPSVRQAAEPAKDKGRGQSPSR